MADSTVSGLTATTTIAGTDFVLVSSGATTKKISGVNLKIAVERPYVRITDRKAEGINGGTFTSGSWQNRDINTEEDDDFNLVTIATNRFTLAAGTYRARIRCPAYNVSRNKARLYNFTDSIIVLNGSTGQHCSGGSSSQTWIVGKFTIAAAKELVIQHRCQVSTTTYGFGVSVGDQWAGDGYETYTEAEFWLIG
jgi:hypothetical protein